MDNDHQISKYDRIRAGLQGSNGVLWTKPSTIKASTFVTGQTETFVVETARHDELGDTVFVEFIDDSGQVVRLALPPKVANVIASQRDALSARRRSRAAKKLAAERKAAGIVPGFMRSKAKR